MTFNSKTHIKIVVSRETHARLKQRVDKYNKKIHPYDRYHAETYENVINELLNIAQQRDR